MIKFILVLWLMFGIFAILLFFIESWRYAYNNISKDITFVDHMWVFLQQAGFVDVFWLSVMFLGGPISLISAIRTIKKITKEFGEKFNIDDEEY